MKSALIPRSHGFRDGIQVIRLAQLPITRSNLVGLLFLLMRKGRGRSQGTCPRSQRPKWRSQDSPPSSVPVVCLLSLSTSLLCPSRLMSVSTPEFHWPPRKKSKFFQLQSRGPRPLLYDWGPLPCLLLQLNSKGLGSTSVQRAEPCLHSTSSGDLLQGNVDCLCLF